MMHPASIVACNIYVTASASHASTLLSLLRSAQDQCQQIRMKEENDDANNGGTFRGASSGSKAMAPVAIVHAYADIPYDRSSFHLAGRSDCVSDVAGRMICNALKEIDLDSSNTSISTDGAEEESRHPFVGLVDHVSVMPINSSDKSSRHNGSMCEAAANAARDIGSQIAETKLVNVHYYGMACPNNTPLAKVRRERTSFFKSGGAIDKDSNTNETTISPKIALKGDTTIGTPSNFVENFNIRLTSNVSFEQAKTLTQFLRGRNISTKGYGVPGVEALTLPYVRDALKGGNVFEVACNLTNPKEGSADDVRLQLEKWIERQIQRTPKSDAFELNYEYFVEDAYPVGTTEDQCISVLLKDNDDKSAIFKNEMFWDKYDNDVYCKFQEFLR